MSRFPQSPAVPVAAAVAASVLLYGAHKRHKNESPAPLRKIGRTAYIHIPTTSLNQSAAFFQAFGLNQLSSDAKYVILACPNSHSSKTQQPYILLEQIEGPSSNNCASDTGCIGRLCLGVKDVYGTVQRLQGNLEPMAPPVCDRPGDAGPDNQESKVVIVAYHDKSSGVMLELVSLDMTSTLTKIAVNVATAIIPSIHFPLFVHANVNASNYQTSLAAYHSLGYSKTAKDYGKIQNNLYKALDIPDPGIAKNVALIQAPDENLFCLDLIEWDKTKPASEGSNANTIRFAITFADLPNDLDRVLLATTSDKNQLWTLVHPPKLVSNLPMPLGGQMLVATIADPDGLYVDVVEYPNPTILQELQINSNTSTTNKVVLVTGCDSGFGRTLACRMALLGFQVVAACYGQAGADYLHNVVAKTVVADLGTTEGVQAVVQQTRGLLNNDHKLWAIVNNAAVCYPGNVEWQSRENYNHAMQVNFMAPVTIVHELINELKMCRGSRVLNVSSVCGMLAQPTNSSYCASKHALEAFSDSLRCELYPYDVHVCVVQPATMKTPLGLSYWDSWYKGYMAAPEDRQSSFQDGDKMNQFLETSRDMLHKAAEDPSVTTTAMTKALVEANPPTRLRTGAAAGAFFRPASWLPDKTKDSLLWKLMGFDAVHITVDK